MKRFLIPILCAASFHAQSEPIPAGLVYQAAAQNGINYISPNAGQAILLQKAGLNWRKIAVTALTDGTMAVLAGGLTKFITMGSRAEIALLVGHQLVDSELVPVLKEASPNPNDIPPVLPMTGTLTPTVNGCTENTIYALYHKDQPVRSIVTSILGATVTFSPQGAPVSRHASGSLIKGFQVVDVLVCESVNSTNQVINNANTDTTRKP